MIRLEEALKIIREHSTSSLETKNVKLEYAAARILAQDVFSDMDFPSFNKSAMDGYVIRKEDIDKTLQVIEFIPAGKKPKKFVEPGTCAKIMTGALLPEGADMVVMKEDVEVKGDRISITKPMSKANILWQGEDVKKGDLLLKKGIRLNPVHIGLLASVGISQPLVYRKPIISILSSGDELVNLNEKPEPPKIRNSNSVQLEVLAKTLGAETINLGQVSDDKNLIFRAVKIAIDVSDVVVITGGASVGDLDFTGEVFEELKAELHFSRLAIQPGKPVLFATIGKKYLFGLSGNPVSSYVQFQLLVNPLLDALTGNKQESKIFKLPLSLDKKRKSAERTLLFPVRINEIMEAEAIDYHGSAHLNAYQQADGMAAFPIGKNELKKGEMVDVRPL